MGVKQRIITAVVIIILATLVVMNTPDTVRASALLYKSYVVRQDRGRDILCDPYIVEKHDYVLKIFKQRGEIAHADFPEFLNIFRRINPQVPNINRIRPGQHIFIPLKKLLPNSIPEQATGVVTIPFVTISTLPDLLNENASAYVIKRGDTVSRLLSRSFAKYGTKEYQEGLRIFQLLNPAVSDLDQIYVNQQVVLPQAALRNQAWYASLFDNTGEISTLHVPSTRSPAPVPKPLPTAGSSLEKAAQLLDARVFNKGTYYFPRPGHRDFQLHLARHPILELADRSRVVFAPPSESGSGIHDEELAAMKSFWESLSVLPMDPDAPIAQILEAYFASTQNKSTQTSVSFSDRGVQVSVYARWWLNRPSGETVGLTPLSEKADGTPDVLLAYLSKHGITLKEIQESTPAEPRDEQVPPKAPIKTIKAGNATAFVPALLHAMNHSYAPNIPITFPYGGIQIPAVSNLVSTRSGISMLVDFGDLYGEAISAIKSSGLNVIQIYHTDSHREIIQKILDALGQSYENDPTFSTSGPSGEFGTRISIPGFLLSASSPDTLLTLAPLDPQLIQYLRSRRLEIIQIRVNHTAS